MKYPEGRYLVVLDMAEARAASGSSTVAILPR